MEKYTNEENLSLVNEYNFKNINFVLYSKGWLNLTEEKRKVLPADEAFLKNIRLVLELDGYNFGRINEEEISNILMLNFDRYTEWANANNIQALKHSELYYKIKYYVKVVGYDYFKAVIMSLKESYAWHCDKIPLPIKNLYDRKLYDFGLSNRRKHGETYTEMNRRYLKTIKFRPIFNTKILAN